jgi:hypothetical protein
MNTKQLLAATALAIVGTAAFAQTSHQLTRAEVRAEYIRARQAGEIPLGTEYTIADTRSSVVNKRARTVSSAQPKTRAEVRSEAVAYTHDRQASSSQLADH